MDWKKRYTDKPGFKAGDKVKYVGKDLNDYFRKGETHIIKRMPEPDDDHPQVIFEDRVGSTHLDWFIVDPQFEKVY